MQKWFECIATAYDPSPNAYIFNGFNNNKSGKEEPVAVDRKFRLNTDLNERYVRFKYIHIETEHCFQIIFIILLIQFTFLLSSLLLTRFYEIFLC